MMGIFLLTYYSKVSKIGIKEIIMGDDIGKQIGTVATAGILAGFSLGVIKQLYPNKYEAERKRRAKRRAIKCTCKNCKKKTTKRK
jgi:hypothetical protein